jgi:hypothetical protein
MKTQVPSNEGGFVVSVGGLVEKVPNSAGVWGGVCLCAARMGAIHFSLDERLIGLFTRELPLETFVETGTFRGETLAMARKYFPECHSGELSPELYAAARDRFAQDPGVTLHFGSSPEFLSLLSAEWLQKPVFFWLDAHWCSADQTAGQSSQSPLLDELQAIGGLHPDSVLLIDDARLYLSTPPAPHAVADWPELHDVALRLFGLSSSHRLCVFDDVIAFYPERLKKVLAEHIHRHAVDMQKLAGDARKHQKRRAKGFRKFWRNK